MLIPDANANLALSMLIPVAVALCVTALVTSRLIPYLKRLRQVQPIYGEAPEEHMRKQGTPTMGGIAILFGITAGTAASTLVNGLSRNMVCALGVTLLFGALGFLDDASKTTKRRNLGLRARHKLAIQILIGAAFACWYALASGNGTSVIVPFAWKAADIGGWIFPYIVFVIVAFANAVNLTDGLDGLASGVSAVVAICMPVIVTLAFGASLASAGELALESMLFDTDAAIFFSSIAGACIGFLAYNRHPAKIFMGDTGSLALGGGFGAGAVLAHSEILLAICGAVFVVETLSVIIQVGSYRLRGGKRVFRMAPLHHHFELGGWHEKKVVGVFTLATVGVCIAVMAACILGMRPVG